MKKYRGILHTLTDGLWCNGETSEKNGEILKRRLKLHFHQGDPYAHAQVQSGAQAPHVGRATVPGFAGQWNNEMASRRKHPVLTFALKPRALSWKNKKFLPSPTNKKLSYF